MSTLPKAVNNQENPVAAQRPAVTKPAFDPLDPQWQTNARVTTQPATPEKTHIATTRPIDAEELQRIEKAGPYVTLARVSFERSKFEEARGHLQEALAINPTDSSGLELLGDIFLAEAEQEKAIKVFERGKKYHPENAAWEEKIAIALLDIEEEKRDAELRQQVLETGDKDRWTDRKPGAAMTLSLLVPGAGQFYNDDNERGGIFIGAALITFSAWMLTLNAALNAVPRGEGARRLVEGLGMAMEQMGGVAKVFFYVMLLAWLGITAFAGWDAFRGAERRNTERRRSLGV